MASHFALFVDLENCGGKKSMLMDVIERVKIRGDILIGKVYGYTDSYSDLKEILLKLFGKIGKLNGRTESNLPVVYHLQNRGNKLGQTEIPLNLGITVRRFSRQQFP